MKTNKQTIGQSQACKCTNKSCRCGRGEPLPIVIPLTTSDQVLNDPDFLSDVLPPSGHNPFEVDHPQYYGGEDNPYEVIKVCEAWGLNKDAYLFNVVKYVARAGKKDASKTLEDLKKALFYLERRIQNPIK